MTNEKDISKKRPASSSFNASKSTTTKSNKTSTAAPSNRPRSTRLRSISIMDDVTDDDSVPISKSRKLNDLEIEENIKISKQLDFGDALHNSNDDENLSKSEAVVSVPCANNSEKESHELTKHFTLSKSPKVDEITSAILKLLEHLKQYTNTAFIEKNNVDLNHNVAKMLQARIKCAINLEKANYRLHVAIHKGANLVKQANQKSGQSFYRSVHNFRPPQHSFNNANDNNQRQLSYHSSHGFPNNSDFDNVNSSFMHSQPMTSQFPSSHSFPHPVQSQPGNRDVEVCLKCGNIGTSNCTCCF